MPRATRSAPGTRCRYCPDTIRRGPAELGRPWVHVADSNVFCRCNVQGHVARFAEPS